MKKFLLLLLLISPFLFGFMYAPAPQRQALPVGHLYIPSQNVDEDIYLSAYSDDTRTWDRSIWDANRIAWLDRTPWIDSEANTALVSHTYGPLHDILWLAVGDPIYIEDDEYIATYVVTETIISAESDVLGVISQLRGPMLTLSVCWGIEQRYIVRAERVSIEPSAVG